MPEGEEVPICADSGAERGASVVARSRWSCRVALRAGGWWAARDGERRERGAWGRARLREGCGSLEGRERLVARARVRARVRGRAGGDESEIGVCGGCGSGIRGGPRGRRGARVARVAGVGRVARVGRVAAAAAATAEQLDLLLSKEGWD